MSEEYDVVPYSGKHDKISELKESIDELLQMFKVASEEMKLERAEEMGVEKRLAPLIQKVDKLIEQNEELARGIVAIADMVKDKMGEKPKIEREFHPRSASPPKREWMPTFAPQGGQGSMGSMSSPMSAPQPPRSFDELPPLGGSSGSDLPPLDDLDLPKKKKGLFG